MADVSKTLWNNIHYQHLYHLFGQWTHLILVVKLNTIMHTGNEYFINLLLFRFFLVSHYTTKNTSHPNLSFYWFSDVAYSATKRKTKGPWSAFLYPLVSKCPMLFRTPVCRLTTYFYRKLHAYFSTKRDKIHGVNTINSSPELDTLSIYPLNWMA